MVRVYSPNDAASPNRFAGGEVRAPGVPGGGSGAPCGERAASAFWMLNHCGQRGGLPPPPRVRFEKPNGSPSLNAK
ncbi:hypothetical protein D3C83_144900 [compost metagenome]